MNSFIIHSSTLLKRKKYILAFLKNQLQFVIQNNELLQKNNHPDIYIIKPDKSISIAQIRSINNFISKKPLRSKYKIVIIFSADLLTLPSQHAILKTLEEATSNTYIFLELYNPNLLLPTILSRCQLTQISKAVSLKNDIRQDPNAKLLNSLTASIGKNIILLRQIKNADQAKDFFSKTLIILKMDLLNGSKTNTNNLLLTQECIKSLKQNVNFKLVLDHFAINYRI